MIVDGVQYVTTAEAIERLGLDVTAGTLRDWKRRGLLRVAHRPDGSAIRFGRQNVYRWSDVVDAEYATRRSAAGRRRLTKIVTPAHHCA